MSESTTTRQTIHQARKLHTQALNSERQANVYYSMADMIRRLDVTCQDETVNHEVARLRKQAEEMMEDHDHLLGQIEPELIDYL